MTTPGRSQTCRWHGKEGCPLCFARVVFWCCPVHVGAPHRVEWREGVAHCLTDGCGRTSTDASTPPTDMLLVMDEPMPREPCVVGLCDGDCPGGCDGEASAAASSSPPAESGNPDGTETHHRRSEP